MHSGTFYCSINQEKWHILDPDDLTDWLCMLPIVFSRKNVGNRIGQETWYRHFRIIQTIINELSIETVNKEGIPLKWTYKSSEDHTR